MTLSYTVLIIAIDQLEVVTLVDPPSCGSVICSSILRPPSHLYCVQVEGSCIAMTTSWQSWEPVALVSPQTGLPIRQALIYINVNLRGPQG